MSKTFAEWSCSDVYVWINSLTLANGIKSAILDAVKAFNIDGDILLACENESDLQDLLNIKPIMVKQLFKHLQSCDFYNESKKNHSTPNTDEGKPNLTIPIPIPIPPLESQKIDLKKIENEVRNRVEKEYQDKENQRKQKEEEEKKKKQQEKAKASQSAFSADNMNKNKHSNEDFFPTFAFSINKQFTEKRFKISPSMLVKDLKTFIGDKYLGNENNKLNSIDLYYSGKLLDDDNQPIKYYGVVSSFQVVMTKTKLIGGAKSQNESDLFHKVRKINTNNSLIMLTNKPDSISFDDDEDEFRALMPCGHAFSAITMYTYVVHCFANDFTHSEFYCPVPKCNTKLDWALVASIADLDDTEFDKYSNIINENQLKKGEIKVCPHCKIGVDRPEKINRNRVHCVICNGSDFCYHCLKPWKNSGLQICGNQECILWTINENILNCPDVKIENYNQIVPKMRACPNCLSIITYEERCKHMKCAVKECRYEFCFSCLEKWPCKNGAGNGAVCPPAPRQKL